MASLDVKNESITLKPFEVIADGKYMTILEMLRRLEEARRVAMYAFDPKMTDKVREMATREALELIRDIGGE